MEGRPPQLHLPPGCPASRCKRSGNSWGGQRASHKHSARPLPLPSPKLKWPQKQKWGRGMRRGPLGFPRAFSGLEALEGPRAGGLRAVDGGLQAGEGWRRRAGEGVRPTQPLPDVGGCQSTDLTASAELGELRGHPPEVRKEGRPRRWGSGGSPALQQRRVRRAGLAGRGCAPHSPGS